MGCLFKVAMYSSSPLRNVFFYSLKRRKEDRIDCSILSIKEIEHN